MARKKTKKKTARKKRTTKKKGARKTARKKTRRKTKKKMARRRGRRSKLANVPVAQLQAELERRQRELLDQREELQQQVDQIDQELAAIGASPRPRRGRPPGRPAGTTRSTRTRGRRPRGKVTLVDALQTALRGKTMGVSEVSQAVQKAGYKTKSKNFRTIVNLALTQHTDKFKRVSRGQYTAK